MKNFFKASFAVGIALSALSVNTHAQNTVAVKALGSSAIFTELGLAAGSATTATPAGLGATCVWTENTNTVVATDTSASGSLTDKGSAFVAWTPVSGSCSVTSSSNTTIYSYLSTDSVVGNRCLFNGSSCTVAYPTTNPPSAGTLFGSSEVALPVSVATALNSAAVNVAGTDIRPEDAEFAIARALTPCGTAVATGSQYLGLGYANGGQINSFYGGSPFNVINFSLPSSFSVTPVGATPILVVVNSSNATSGFNASGITSIGAKYLAGFLDGTYSYTSQTNSASTTGGLPVTTIIREPLSGTYNTMEYNIPNATVFKTSQDVGVNQTAGQVNCSGTAVGSNPMNIATPSGGARRRAIGTGQELSEVIANANSIGYGFWSVGNFKGFTSASAPYARYLQVIPPGSTTAIDPLLNSSTPYSTYNGTLPLAGSAELANVDLHTTANGSYPIWSLLRLVNTGSTPLAGVTALQTASQNFVPTGTTTARPDFVQFSNLLVVRSHFIPPAGTGEPTTAANGHVGLPSSSCTIAEAGGDVGGVAILLATDSNYCKTHSKTGETGQRN